MVDKTVTPLRHRHDELAAGWQLAVRVAMSTGLLAGALGVSLHYFAGVSSGVIVAATAALGLVIGVKLPAARPPIEQWLGLDIDPVELPEHPG